MKDELRSDRVLIRRLALKLGSMVDSVLESSRLIRDPLLNKTMSLTQNTLRSGIGHEETTPYTSELLQNLDKSIHNQTLPQYISWPSRFAYRVSNSTVHIPTGLTFLADRLISQSGQVYVDSFMDAVMNKVTLPSRKRIKGLPVGEYFVIPKIHAYWHWIVEWLPVVLGMLELSNKIKIVTSPGQPDYVRESVEMLGAELIETSSKWLHLPNLWLVDKAPFGPVHPEDLARVRAFVNLVAPNEQRTAGESKSKVYVSRSGYKRAMQNEPALENWLEDKGFTIFRPSDVGSFSSQIEIFSSADLILGSAGSGLGNSMLMPPGGSVVELFSDLLFDNVETVAFYGSIGVQFKRIFMNSSEELPYGDAEFAIQKLVESDFDY